MTVQMTDQERAELPLREQMKVAEERSWALLRALVDPKDWDGDINHPIQFTAASGRTYEIHVGRGHVENIVTTSPAGYRRRICCAPWAWNEYATPTSTSQGRGAHVDGELYQKARDEASAAGLNVVPGIPRADLFLGQYLALKYDEQAFLEKAIW